MTATTSLYLPVARPKRGGFAGALARKMDRKKFGAGIDGSPANAISLYKRTPIVAHWSEVGAEIEDEEEEEEEERREERFFFVGACKECTPQSK